MQINLKNLREFRESYNDAKAELGEVCDKINEYARFLGCVQKSDKPDVRVSLGFLEGYLAALEQVRSNK